MDVLRNRCSGCEHYNGFVKDNVQCDLGQRTTIDRGCGQFTPDNTANCYECYFNENGAKSFDITCSKHGYIKGQREYCYDYALRWGGGSSSSSKGGCFVTTAICQILGKDDDCYELETLRRFRDQVLLNDEKLKSIVFDYYEVSPSIVSTLESLDSKEEFSIYLLHNHIRKIVDEIENDKNIEAVDSYKQMLKEIIEAK